MFVNCRDRISDLRLLVEWLERAGHERIILLDNQSTYEPLRVYLAQSPHKVVHLRHNYGSRALWINDNGVRPPDELFVFTDPDVVPCDECPLDAVQHLAEVMARHDDVAKVGLGLYLDDVPANMPSLAWERGPEINGPEVEPGARRSLIDTTFALYRPGSEFEFHALRTGLPYLARHLPWYRTVLDDEHRFYMDHAARGPEGTSWELP